MIVDIPADLNPSSILSFSQDLDDLPEAESFEFDFGPSRWFPPFSMLLLPVVLKRFRDSRPLIPCRARYHEHHTYAAYFGFFQSFGLRHGKEPGEARGGESYVPITRLGVANIKEEAATAWVETGEIIEARARELSGVLTQTDNGPLFDTLSYALREIIRNIVEHSEAQDVLLCAQHWPTRHEVEVGIADAGIGIQQGLARNPMFRGLANRDALQTALMPGVSGNPRAGVGQDVWQNSGYGLYMTNRICRNGGRFMIRSGDSAISLSQTEKTDLSCNFPGTAVRLLLNTARLPALREQLQRFRDEGHQAAQTIRGANRSFSSTASQMLSIDFDLDGSF